MHLHQCNMSQHRKKHSAAGTRTQVAPVRAEYPNQLDYSGCCIDFGHGPLQQLFRAGHLPVLSKHVRAPLLTFRPTPTPTRCQGARSTRRPAGIAAPPPPSLSLSREGGRGSPYLSLSSVTWGPCSAQPLRAVGKFRHRDSSPGRSGEG